MLLAFKYFLGIFKRNGFLTLLLTVVIELPTKKDEVFTSLKYI